VETEMSRGVKIEQIKRTEPIKSRLADNEIASGKEVRAGILVEYKDHPEIDRIDLSLLHALNHGVDETAKTILGVTELSEALGRKVGKDKLEIANSMKMKVNDFKKPTKVVELQSFLGLLNNSRSFLDKYAHLARELSVLCPYNQEDPKGRKNIVWNPIADKSYELLRELIAENKGLAYIADGVPFEVRTDASNGGVGAVISQLVDGVRNDIAFFSMKFNEVQKRWPTIEQEAFGIFRAVQQWQDLLIKRKFKIFTDHRNLTFILSSESKKLTRWRLALQEFVFDIHHIAGVENVEADYLSRVHV